MLIYYLYYGAVIALIINIIILLLLNKPNYNNIIIDINANIVTFILLPVKEKLQIFILAISVTYFYYLLRQELITFASEYLKSILK